MEVRQLNTLIRAAQFQSFSKAAESLGYSQSAVTVQIKELEEELGVRLFDRMGKRVILTAQGQCFLEYANSILDTIQNLIPSNPVAAFANGNMLQVLVFAVIVGFTLIAIGEKGAALLKVIGSCNEVGHQHSYVFYPNRCLLYYRSGCGGQRYRDYYLTGYPACNPVPCILWICLYCVRRRCEVHR